MRVCSHTVVVWATSACAMHCMHPELSPGFASKSALQICAGNRCPHAAADTIKSCRPQKCSPIVALWGFPNACSLAHGFEIWSIANESLPISKQRPFFGHPGYKEPDKRAPNRVHKTAPLLVPENGPLMRKWLAEGEPRMARRRVPIFNRRPRRGHRRDSRTCPIKIMFQAVVGIAHLRARDRKCRPCTSRGVPVAHHC
jgi:hypothetical protein